MWDIWCILGKIISGRLEPFVASLMNQQYGWWLAFACGLPCYYCLSGIHFIIWNWWWLAATLWANWWYIVTVALTCAICIACMWSVAQAILSDCNR